MSNLHPMQNFWTKQGALEEEAIFLKKYVLSQEVPVRASFRAIYPALCLGSKF